MCVYSDIIVAVLGRGGNNLRTLISKNVWKKSVSVSALAFFAAVAIATSAQAGEKLSAQAHVTRVKDGDTLVAQLDEGRTITVRLWGVDTPEPDQPWGTHAGVALQDMVEDAISLECPNKDRSGRWVCRVRDRRGTDINLTLVQHGHAWWDKHS